MDIPSLKKTLIIRDLMKKPIFLLIVLCLLLSACNSGKNSPSSGHGTPDNGNTNPPEPEELPGVPGNLRATPGDRQVTLSWGAPSTVGASAITSYEYQYSTTSDSFGNTWTHVPGTGTTVTISSLAGATTYFFHVRAVNTQGPGVPSTKTEAIAYDGPTAEPGTPTNPMATSGDRQVTLSWGAPSTVGASAITSYEYQYSTTSDSFGNTWTHVPGTGTTVTISSLAGATTYFFHVRAVNTQGPGVPSTKTEAIAYDGPTAEPGTPTNPMATSGDRQVTLSWGAPSTVGASAITSYEYQYSTTSDSFGNTWTHVPGTGTTVTISSLAGATTYFFHVRAVNTQGPGVPSTKTEAIAYDGPTAEPGTPTNPMATSGDRQVTLSWGAPSTVGASAITSYEYQYSTTSDSFGNTWTHVPGTGTTVTISSLIAGTTYHFQVRAVNAQGAGIPSNASQTPHDGTINPETVCSDPATTDSALPGKGTVDNPFALCSPAHLSLIGDTVTNAAYTLSASYVMGQDIDLNNVSFTPIAGAFTGILDGRDKKIMNLTINVSSPAALFVELGSEGNIKNLGIEEFDVTGSERVGSLVVSSSGTITSCYAVDSDEATDLSGGVNSYVGGLVGYQDGGSITSSYATGNPVARSNDNYVGGLVGYQDGGSITSSYATGDPVAENDYNYVGGLVGYQNSGSITSSYATGNPVAGSDYNYVGGLVGYRNGGSITSSYATGDPEGGKGRDYIGGLVGGQYSGSITSSYATGNPEGEEAKRLCWWPGGVSE